MEVLRQSPYKMHLFLKLTKPMCTTLLALYRRRDQTLKKVMPERSKIFW